MDPEARRHEQLARLFARAVELDGKERTAFLDAACRDDAERRTELEALLAEDERPLELAGLVHRVLGQRPEELLAPVAPRSEGEHPRDAGTELEAERLAGSGSAFAEAIPERVAGFRLLRRIGEGGMSTVYEAEQESPRRRVALKLLRPGIASRANLRRFEREAQLLARLRHPGILEVYQSGVHEEGGASWPYIAMALVDGQPLTQWAREKGLGLTDRIELLVRVCDAVEHAHRHGIVHRDLKPGNILVEDSGQPKVLDFGIAQAREHDDPATEVYTQHGAIIGTVAYMSPEQVAGDRGAIDARTDVFALGILLYELLRGERPLPTEGLDFLDALRVVAEHEAPRLGSEDPRLRGDLEVIAAKALEKQQERRYASAGALGLDLRRYLRHETISAKPVGLARRTARAIRRNPLLTASLGAITLSLLAGLVTTTWQWQIARRAHQAAELAAGAARWQSYLRSVQAASAALVIDDTEGARAALEGAPPDLRNWEWEHLHARLDGSLGVLARTDSVLDAVWLDPRGAQLHASERDSERLHGWTLAEGRAEPQAPSDREVLDVVYLADGRPVGAARAPGGVELIDLASDAVLARVPVELGPLLRGRLSSDGRRLLFTVVQRSIVGLLDLDSGRTSILRTEPGYNVWSLALDAAGARAAWGMEDGEIVVRELDGAARSFSLSGHSAPVVALAFDEDGRRLLSGSRDFTARLWTTEGAALRVLSGHLGAVGAVAFRDAARRAVTGAEDGVLRFWDVESGTLLATRLGHEGAIRAIAGDSSRARLVTAADDRTLRLWDDDPRRDASTLRGHESYVYPTAFSADGSLVASGAWDGTARLWSREARTALVRLEVGGRHVLELAFGPEDRRLATADEMGEIRLWDRETGELLAAIATGGGRIDALAFDPGGEILFSGSQGGVAAWRLEDGARLAWRESRPNGVHDLALSPDGLRLAAGHFDGSIALLQPGTLVLETLVVNDGSAPSTIAGWPRGLDPLNDAAHQRDVHALAFDPAGRLVTASYDGAVRIWELAPPRLVATLEGHRSRVLGVAVSPDGERIASTGDDAVLRLWDARSGTRLVTLRGHSDYAYSVAFSPDGRAIATGSGDRTVRLWETSPQGQRGPR